MGGAVACSIKKGWQKAVTPAQAGGVRARVGPSRLVWRGGLAGEKLEGGVDRPCGERLGAGTGPVGGGLSGLLGLSALGPPPTTQPPDDDVS